VWEERRIWNVKHGGTDSDHRALSGSHESYSMVQTSVQPVFPYLRPINWPATTAVNLQNK